MELNSMSDQSVKNAFAKIGRDSASKKMTNEQKIERARKAGSMKGKKGLPTASHVGELKIGTISLPCAVVDGRRVISQSAVYKAFGGKYRGRKSAALIERIGGTPDFLPFLASQNLIAFVDNDLEKKMGPLKFLWKNTNSITYGYDASIIPDICKLFLLARKTTELSKIQLDYAETSEILLGALATVGITALVDEASGYQEEREKGELTTLLNKYISEEMLPWTKRFPVEFFKQIYKLHGWKWGQFAKNHPSYVGKFINKTIYEKLPLGVLEELQTKNPVTDTGHRAHLHHQFLTEDVGNDHLSKQITKVITLMQLSGSVGEFNNLMEKIFPGSQLILDI